MRTTRRDLDLLAEAYDDVAGPRDMGATEDAEDLETAFHRAARQHTRESMAYDAGRKLAMQLGDAAIEHRDSIIEQFTNGFDSGID